MSALQSERPQPARAAACIPPVHRHACTARWFAVRDAPGERRRGPAFRIPRLASVFSIVARSSFFNEPSSPQFSRGGAVGVAVNRAFNFWREMSQASKRGSGKLGFREDHIVTERGFIPAFFNDWKI